MNKRSVYYYYYWVLVVVVIGQFAPQGGWGEGVGGPSGLVLLRQGQVQELIICDVMEGVIQLALWGRSRSRSLELGTSSSVGSSRSFRLSRGLSRGLCRGLGRGLSRGSGSSGGLGGCLSSC